MLTSQQDTFDVPTGLTTLLTIRAAGIGYERSFYLQNLTADDLACQISYSNDGGNSWTTIATAFTITAMTQTVFTVDADITGILRVQASGGGNDRDLVIGYTRLLNSTAIWIDPVS